MERPVLPLLQIDIGVDDHAAPLKVHEPCLLECFFIGLRRPEVVVELGVSSFRLEFDVDRVSFFDRRFVRSVNTGIFVGFVKIFLIGDKRIRVNANEPTASIAFELQHADSMVQDLATGMQPGATHAFCS